MRDEGDMIAGPPPLTGHRLVVRRVVIAARFVLAITLIYALLTAALVLSHG